MMLVWLLFLIPASWLLLLLCYREPVVARWREPVLRHPVLVLESDDWGAGPLSQAPALERIARTLELYRDETGHPAVMTLGLVLACPRAAGVAEDALVTLLDPSQADTLSAIRVGAQRGVFSPQLHGLCHFEPGVLAASGVAWPQEAEEVWTETLPDPLQSALVDASRLPSKPLDASVLTQSAHRQGEIWRQLFASDPQVAVPTTFIWSDAAERAWRAIGVRWLITPGRRASGRDAQGKPAGIDRFHLTGQSTATGLVSLVRDIYFEPARGHDAHAVLAASSQHFALGRAALIEIHRGNFVGPASASDSLEKLGRFLDHIIARWPKTRFVSSAKLGAALVENDPAWVVRGHAARAPFLLLRILEIPGFRRLAKYSGLGAFLVFLARTLR